MFGRFVVLSGLVGLELYRCYECFWVTIGRRS